MTKPQQPWARLSQRGKPPVEETLYEGVPVHLEEPLVEWVTRAFLAEPLGASSPALRAVTLQLRLPSRDLNGLVAYVRRDHELLLDVLDATLWTNPRSPIRMGDSDVQPLARELETILARGGSAWRVAADQRSLERRVDETVTQAVASAATPGTSAADHLAAAWSATYGRKSDPTKAYSEAIKAVEAVAAPVVSPNNSKATLGTIIGDLKQSSAGWELAILGPDRSPREISALLSMLELLWQGQSDRHGGIAPTVPIPDDAAPMALHLAVTLMQWFQSGAVRKRP